MLIIMNSKLGVIFDHPTPIIDIYFQKITFSPFWLQKPPLPTHSVSLYLPIMLNSLYSFNQSSISVQLNYLVFSEYEMSPKFSHPKYKRFLLEMYTECYLNNLLQFHSVWFLWSYLLSTLLTLCVIQENIVLCILTFLGDLEWNNLRIWASWCSSLQNNVTF